MRWDERDGMGEGWGGMRDVRWMMAVEIRLPDVRASAHVYFLHSEAATPTGPTDVAWICLRASSSPRLTSHCRRVLEISAPVPRARARPAPVRGLLIKIHMWEGHAIQTHSLVCGYLHAMQQGVLLAVGWRSGGGWRCKVHSVKNAPKEYRGVPRQTHLGLGRTTAGVSDGRYYIYVYMPRKGEKRKETKPSDLV